MIRIFFDRPLRSVAESIVLEKMSTVKIDKFGTVAIKCLKIFALTKNFSYFFWFFMGFTSSLSALVHLWICGLYIIVSRMTFSSPKNFLKWTLSGSELFQPFLFMFLSQFLRYFCNCFFSTPTLITILLTN